MNRSYGCGPRNKGGRSRQLESGGSSKGKKNGSNESHWEWKETPTWPNIVVQRLGQDSSCGGERYILLICQEVSGEDNRKSTSGGTGKRVAMQRGKRGGSRWP